MALETVTHINDLDINNPPGTDPKSQGDDHLRNIKKALKADLPMTQAAGAKGLNILYGTVASAIRELLGFNNTGYRNRVINGDMTVDQRWGGASQTITAGANIKWITDRFFVYCAGANLSARQSISGTSTYNLQITGATGNTGLGFGTRLPAVVTLSLPNAVTLSASLSTTFATTVTWAVYYGQTPDAFGSVAAPSKTLIATGTFSSTSTPTTFSANFTGGLKTNGWEILFTTTSLLNGNTLNVSSVQLEPGTIANSDIIYESVDYLTNLMRCQQYYAETNCSARAYATIANQNIDSPIYFPVQMRTIPTAQLKSTVGTVINSTGEVVGGITKQAARFSMQSVAVGDSLSVDRLYAFDAEMNT